MHDTARVAVIGSGPAGLYATDELCRHGDVTVDVIDRLPCPYGLLRYGVAPDHLKMKSLETTLRRTVNRGSENVTLSVSRSTMQQLDRQRNAETSLSARELAVLKLVAQALSNAQVGDRLLISEGTVKRHLTNIYGKLNAVSRVDAIKRATGAGLLNDMDDD